MNVNKKNYKKELLNVLFFQYSISFGSRNSTYYLHCSFHTFELRWGVFNKTGEIDSRPATLPKKACVKEVFLQIYQNLQCFFNKV